MTDKFDKQIYESGLIAQGCWDELDDYAKEAIVKFGELIVKNCASQVDYILAEGGKTQGDIIREHFGVTL